MITWEQRQKYQRYLLYGFIAVFAPIGILQILGIIPNALLVAVFPAMMAFGAVMLHLKYLDIKTITENSHYVSFEGIKIFDYVWKILVVFGFAMVPALFLVPQLMLQLGIIEETINNIPSTIIQITSYLAIGIFGLYLRQWQNKIRVLNR